MFLSELYSVRGFVQTETHNHQAHLKTLLVLCLVTSACTTRNRLADYGTFTVMPFDTRVVEQGSDRWVRAFDVELARRLPQRRFGNRGHAVVSGMVTRWRINVSKPHAGRSGFLVEVDGLLVVWDKNTGEVLAKRRLSEDFSFGGARGDEPAAMDVSWSRYVRGLAAFDWFFLAMAKHRLGHKDAREWYDEAVAWMEKDKPDDKELKRFRAEAEEVLGITDGE